MDIVNEVPFAKATGVLNVIVVAVVEKGETVFPFTVIPVTDESVDPAGKVIITFLLAGT